MLLSTQTEVIVDRLGFEEGVRVLKNAGYDALDLSLFNMKNDDDEYVAENWKETVAARKRFCDELGVRFNQSHAPFSFRFADTEIRENVAWPRVVRSLEISAMMGVDTVVVHPLHYLEYKYNTELMWQMNLDYYRKLLVYAKEYDVRICVENMWRTDPKRKYIDFDVASRAEELARYIDTLNDEHIVACLDLGHCGLIGEEAEDAIRLLGHDRLHALHVHDNDYKSDAHTIPGLGKMDWTAIMQALKEIDYDGYLTYEADGFLKGFLPQMLPDAVNFMEKIGRHLLSLS